MTTTRPPSYQPRLIDHVEDHGGSGRDIRLPEQWLRGLLAGAEAFILGWMVLVIPAVATYVATAASPALGSAGWMEAAQIATAGWFLAHGAPLGAGGWVISVVPLGLTLLYVVVVATAVRRARLATWIPVLVAVGTYVALGSLLLFLTAPADAAWGLCGAVLVAAAGAVWGLRGRYPALPGPLARIDLPPWLRVGVAASWRTVVALLAIATVTLGVAIVMGFEQIVGIHRSLHADVVSTVVLVLAMVLVLPVLAVWSLAFLLGPGFSVGAGTIFSPSGIDSGPLPLIPVLGALPEPDSLAGDAPFVVAIGLGVGLLAGWWLVHRQRQVPLWQPLAALGVSVLGAVAVVALLGWLASGGIGPGAMTQIGGDPVAMAWAAGWQLAVGGTVAVVGLHPDTKRGVARGVGWVRAHISTRAATSSSATERKGEER